MNGAWEARLAAVAQPGEELPIRPWALKNLHDQGMQWPAERPERMRCAQRAASGQDASGQHLHDVHAVHQDARHAKGGAILVDVGVHVPLCGTRGPAGSLLRLRLLALVASAAFANMRMARRLGLEGWVRPGRLPLFWTPSLKAADLAYLTVA